eukprot:4650182-Amphidinium_carterae.1
MKKQADVCEEEGALAWLKGVLAPLFGVALQNMVPNLSKRESRAVREPLWSLDLRLFPSSGLQAVRCA